MARTETATAAPLLSLALRRTRMSGGSGRPSHFRTRSPSHRQTAPAAGRGSTCPASATEHTNALSQATRNRQLSDIARQVSRKAALSPISEFQVSRLARAQGTGHGPARGCRRAAEQLQSRTARRLQVSRTVTHPEHRPRAHTTVCSAGTGASTVRTAWQSAGRSARCTLVRTPKTRTKSCPLQPLLVQEAPGRRAGGGNYIRNLGASPK